jgi:outer membrane protein OmpA-like peptidoglycan-associated protein
MRSRPGYVITSASSRLSGRPGPGQARRPRPGRQVIHRSRRDRQSWRRSQLGLVTALCLAGVLLAAVFVVRARVSGCRTPPATLIDAVQTTAEEGYDPGPPGGLLSQAEFLSSCSGGTLITLAAAGQGAQAGFPVALRAYREPGQLEHDAAARSAEIRALISRALRRLLLSPARGDGRDLIGLLAAISNDRDGRSTEVWLATFGLPTVAPADARVLMAADPVQAAQSIRRWLPNLRGVRVHVILNPAAGYQPLLNTATDAWRRAFVTDILRDAGASVISVSESQVREQSAPGAPSAPSVPNLPEATPRPPGPPAHARLYRIRLDTAAFFAPNSTAFATSRQRVRASLAPVIAAWKTGGYARVQVVGRCARFGPPDGALALSRERARIIAAMLRAAGVTHVTATGFGYSRPLPPNPYSATNRVVTVTIYPRTKA